MALFDEGDYLRGLADYNNLDKEAWLVSYFDLYKSTLNWPDGLPPIRRCYMYKGTLREKFHSYYKDTLEEFPHKLDNVKKSLILF